MSLIGILITTILRSPTPIEVQLPSATGTADIIADFVASLERAEASRYPVAVPPIPGESEAPEPVVEEWKRDQKTGMFHRFNGK